ncbi:MAG TPA: hypothetical protein VNM40_04255 [Candidatus Paceibacterota bacterium]|nr:hypothetical protein [Candidatus Paceibacterota bacterium]
MNVVALPKKGEYRSDLQKYGVAYNVEEGHLTFVNKDDAYARDNLFLETRSPCGMLSTLHGFDGQAYNLGKIVGIRFHNVLEMLEDHGISASDLATRTMLCGVYASRACVWRSRLMQEPQTGEIATKIALAAARYQEMSLFCVCERGSVFIPDAVRQKLTHAWIARMNTPKAIH